MEFFYNYPFDPSNPNSNLIAQNDDGGSSDSNQFRINVTLQSSRTYVLVVTTYSTTTTGSFLVIALGPALISLTPFIPTSK